MYARDKYGSKLNWQILTLLPLLFIFSASVIGCGENAKAPITAEISTAVDNNSAQKKSSILCLRTNPVSPSKQTFPFARNRLFREIVRQNVLIIAREDLGLITRDETLAERFPERDSNGNRPTICNLDLAYNKIGDFNASLIEQEISRSAPLWKHEAKVNFDILRIYPNLIDQVLESADQIAMGLSRVGASSLSKEFNPTNTPPASIKKLLLEMNFVSQYGAIKSAHQAISDQGASLEWWGVLVRGYSHLSLLTEHTWCSQSDVFAARALLYAEKMVRHESASELTSWHQAYASAMVGLHAIALEQAEAIIKSDEKKSIPVWAGIIVPYVKFQHGALEEYGESNPTLNQLASLLKWKQYRCYAHGRWIYEKGVEAMQVCPDAYGIYSVMANWSALGIKRTGARRAAMTFPTLLPQRVAQLDGLPVSVKELVDQEETPNWIAQIAGMNSSSVDRSMPLKISQALRSSNAKGTAFEFSWDILSQLILEEQFNQSVNTLRVAGDSVEYSKAELINRMLKLTEGSRYFEYLKTFSSSYGQVDEPRKLISIYDPRGNMARMLRGCYPEMEIRAVEERNLTMSGIVEAFFRIASVRKEVFNEKKQADIQHDYESISPYSPNAKRAIWQTRGELSKAELEAYEKMAGTDPLSWLDLGNRYFSASDWKNVVRCLERSLAISPCYDATNQLANAYYHLGNKDLAKWEETLLGYLKLRDLGLMASIIHSQIADVYIAERNWIKAAPHADEAATSYSATSLLKAAAVHEGMQDHEKSEHYYSEATRSYPTYTTGTDWYFWCKRNGRGDVNSARDFAEKHFDYHSKYRDKPDMVLKVVIYNLLEEKPSKAIELIEQKLLPVSATQVSWSKMYYQLLYLCVACQLKDEAKIKNAIESLKIIGNDSAISQYPDWVVVSEGLNKAFLGDELEEDFFRVFDKAMSETSVNYRANYSTFLGIALDQQGKNELADKYLGLAVFQMPVQQYLPNLAGARLVKRHGPNRGGLPEAFAKMEVKTKDPGNNANENEVAEEGARKESAAEEETEK